MRSLTIPLLVILLIPLLPVKAQQWDLELERVTTLPIDAKVQQGQALTISAQIRNRGDSPFSGQVRLEVYVDDHPVIVEIWSLGETPVPVGGLAAITRKLNTSDLSIGVHELKVEVLPTTFTDPDLKNNIYTLTFVVTERAKAYIEIEELLQGVESTVYVSIDNPTSESLNLRVRLLVNGTEVGVDEVLAPPSTVSLAVFKYKPEKPGVVKLKALVMKGSALFAETSYMAEVRPTCDVGVDEVIVPKVIYVGEEVEATIYLINNGSTTPRSVFRVKLDDEVVHEEEVEEYGKVKLTLPTADLAMGEHGLQVTLEPIDVVDLNEENNKLYVSFKVKPVPVLMYANARDGRIAVNLTNAGEMVADFRVAVSNNGSEVDSMLVTLSPDESKLLTFELEPGNYTVTVYQGSYKIVETQVKLEGPRSMESGGIDPLPVIIAVLIATIAGFVAYKKLRRRKWPAE